MYSLKLRCRGGDERTYTVLFHEKPTQEDVESYIDLQHFEWQIAKLYWMHYINDV